MPISRVRIYRPAGCQTAMKLPKNTHTHTPMGQKFEEKRNKSKLYYMSKRQNQNTQGDGNLQGIRFQLFSGVVLQQ